MPSRFVVVPAAYVLLLRERQVLLQLRQNTGYMDGHWACCIAGHVEEGESVFATALREGLEEMGIELSGGSLTPLTSVHRRGGPEPVEQRVDWFFTCTRWSGEPRIMEPDKCADLRWFDLDDLPGPIPPHEELVLRRYAAGDVPPILAIGF